MEGPFAHWSAVERPLNRGEVFIRVIGLRGENLPGTCIQPQRLQGQDMGDRRGAVRWRGRFYPNSGGRHLAIHLCHEVVGSGWQVGYDYRHLECSVSIRRVPKLERNRSATNLQVVQHTVQTKAGADHIDGRAENNRTGGVESQRCRWVGIYHDETLDCIASAIVADFQGDLLLTR